MLRVDQEIIISMVSAGHRVLDLGCGDGELLATLQANKQVEGYGLDLDMDNITQCLAKQVNVIMKDLNEGLEDFEENDFDTVIVANTLQVTQRPDLLLKEILRVGRTCIVTLPNFGHWRCRSYLMFEGRMPVSNHLPHQWYETPNIHLCTFRDFEQLCQELELKIVDRRIVDADYQATLKSKLWPNMFGAFGLYRLEKL